MTLADLAVVHIGRRLAVAGQAGTLIGFTHQQISTQHGVEQATEYLLDVGRSVPVRGCYISARSCSLLVDEVAA